MKYLIGQNDPSFPKVIKDKAKKVQDEARKKSAYSFATNSASINAFVSLLVW